MQLYEMATLRKKDSGLPVTLYIDDSLSYKRGKHSKRVKFQTDKGDKPNTRGKVSSMTLDGKVVEKTLPTKLEISQKGVFQLTTDYSFIDCHIAKENIGEHDGDNRFLMEPFDKQIEKWQEDHPSCTLVGICYEDPHPYYDGYYPMVYEDQDGNRFWVHWCLKTLEEYKEAGLLETPIQGNCN